MERTISELHVDAEAILYTLGNFIVDILVDHALENLPCLQIGSVQLLGGQRFVMLLAFLRVFLARRTTDRRSAGAASLLILLLLLFGLRKIIRVRIVDDPLQDIRTVPRSRRRNRLRLNGLCASERN